MGLIEQINCVNDLKLLSISQLKEYASEVRQFIVDSVNITGGHLSSNLGTIEMTIALHYVFNVPNDKIIWDVGHQSYTHKIITGRREKFDLLRQNGGISGFPKMSESDCDAFSTGHASTSLSVGLGLIKASELTGEKFNVVSVIGDGALTGGMAFEAMNHIGAIQAPMAIVLNDNKMSISKNVGAISSYLGGLRMSKRYGRLKTNIKKGVSALPFFGDSLVHVLESAKNSVKAMLQVTKIFESFGLKYIGPVDGHNLEVMINLFRKVKSETGPVLLHLVTNKGNGICTAQENPSKYHGVAPKSLSSEKSFSNILGETLSEIALSDKRIVAISAAMIDGTGLKEFNDKFPKRCFDVGIAEGHGATFSAGLSAHGIKPFFAVYSSFLQRAFDSVIHDICINSLPVTLCVDRAGAIGADGVTHQGIYDISFLNLVPGMTIFAPKDGAQFKEALKFAASFDKPLAIRYPKSYINDYPSKYQIQFCKWDLLQKSEKKVFLLCVGSRMLDIVHQNCEYNIINACFVKPLDEKMLNCIAANKEALIITLEDNAVKGGFGESVVTYCNRENLPAKIVNLGFDDKFLDNFSVEDSLVSNGLTFDNIQNIVKKYSK